MVSNKIANNIKTALSSLEYSDNPTAKAKPLNALKTSIAKVEVLLSSEVKVPVSKIDTAIGHFLGCITAIGNSGRSLPTEMEEQVDRILIEFSTRYPETIVGKVVNDIQAESDTSKAVMSHMPEEAVDVLLDKEIECVDEVAELTEKLDSSEKTLFLSARSFVFSLGFGVYSCYLFVKGIWYTVRAVMNLKNLKRIVAWIADKLQAGYKKTKGFFSSLFGKDDEELEFKAVTP